MKISRFLMLLIAMTMIVFAGCEDDPVTPDKCKDVTCEEGFACDPGDGLCYDSTTDKCAGVTCGDNESCNPDNGLCEEINIGEMDTIVKVRMFSSVSGSQEGILLEKPLEGVVVAIKGLPTSNKHAVILRQADANEYAGIYVNLDGLKAEEGFPTLAIGNLIEIKGKVVEYFDRTELLPQAVSDIVVKTASVTLPAPIDVKSSDFQEKYESMVLNLTNVPFTVTTAIKINYCGGEGDSPCPEGETCQDNGHCSGNVYDTTLTGADSKVVKVSSSFAYPRINLALGEVVNKLAGAMTFDYGEFKLYPRDAADVGGEVVTCDPACEAGESCVNGTCVATSPENTEEACSDNEDNDGDTYVDCDDFDCNNTVACGGTPDKCAEVTCENAGEVCDPADGVCKAVETKTLGEIRTAEAGLSNDGFADGGTYKTSGTVTAIIATGSNMGFYIQDATGGIMVYTKAVAPTVTLGDTVDVTGQVGNYYGLLRFLEDAVIGTPAAGTVPAATELTATNLVEANESMFVKVTGGPFTVVSTDTHANTTVKDASGNEFVILNDLFEYTAPMDGAVYSNLQGILTFNYGAYKVMPRNADDMATVTFDCTANPCDDNFEYCSADDTCTLVPGKCGLDTDCDAGDVCNMTSYVCETPAPECATPCADYETCTATDTCTLNAGRCNVVEDCNDGATSCDANTCVGGTAPQFPNADFSVWTDDATPTDWMMGNSGFTASKVTVSGTDFALNMAGENSSNKYLVSTALTTMTDTRPTTITFDMNGSGKTTVNIACDLDGDETTTGEQKFYNLEAGTENLANSGSNAYVEFDTAGAWKTFTITVGDELVDFWKAGTACRLEFKAGKDFAFDASLDNVMINY